MSTLSGRVWDLEKQVLALPTSSDFSSLTALSTARFNTIIDSLTFLSNAVQELQIKLTNIEMNAASGAAHTHKDNQQLAGSVNGTNPAFILSETPIPASVEIFKNGMLQKQGAGNDYILSSTTVTFESGNIPGLGDNILASYRT